MRWLLERLRRAGGQDDRRAGYDREQAAFKAALGGPALDARFTAEMARRAARPGDCVRLGVAASAPELPVYLSFADVVGTGHALVLGGSGGGKTRLVAAIAMSVLDRVIDDPTSCGAAFVDHKSDFVPLVHRLLADRLLREPEVRLERFLSRVVTVNPFSPSALVPMNVLVPEAGVPAEVQAYDVTSLIDRIGGADLGVRQDTFLYHLVLLGIVGGGIGLPELAGLLNDAPALARLARVSPSLEVQQFFSGAVRIGAQSLEGVRARLHRLLRLPSSRLMLGAKSCVSFRELLGAHTLFVDVGSAPLGVEDIGRFWAGLVTIKIARAIFARSTEDATRPVSLFVDEWQEGLAAGGGIADDYERVLAMARSRGVSAWLVSQSLAGAAKVSATLPKVVATNTNVQLLFRASQDDARAMRHLLPVTGRRRRAQPLPWEEAHGSPFLSRSDELEMLVEDVSSMRARHAYLWQRGAPYRAQLVRSRDVDVVGAGGRHEALRRRLEQGALARSIADLEAEATGATPPGDGYFGPAAD